MNLNNEYPKIDLLQYATLLDELENNSSVESDASERPVLVHQSERDSRPNNGSIQSETTSDVNGSVIEQLSYHQTQLNSLREELATLEVQQCTEKVKAIIATNTAALSQLQRELPFVNDNIRELVPVKGNKLTIVDKSVQSAQKKKDALRNASGIIKNEETVHALSNICGGLDELTNNNEDIDCETVKQKLKDKVADLKELESQMSYSLKNQTKLFAKVKDNMPSNS